MCQGLGIPPVLRYEVIWILSFENRYVCFLKIRDLLRNTRHGSTIWNGSQMRDYGLSGKISQCFRYESKGLSCPRAWGYRQCWDRRAYGFWLFFEHKCLLSENKRYASQNTAEQNVGSSSIRFWRLLQGFCALAGFWPVRWTPLYQFTGRGSQ